MRTLVKLGLRWRPALFDIDWAAAARALISSLIEQLYTRLGLRTESGYDKLMRR